MTQTLNYYDYITSDEWYERTKDIRLRNNGRCECCNMRFAEEVHHRSYLHLGNELDSELIHICNWCHKMIHGLVPIGYVYLWPSRIAFLQELRQEAIANGVDKEKKSCS